MRFHAALRDAHNFSRFGDAEAFRASQQKCLALAPGRSAWLHLARGRIRLNGQELGPGDGAAIQGEESLELVGVEAADLVVWELPA